jgi:hypothetical protein
MDRKAMNVGVYREPARAMPHVAGTTVPGRERSSTNSDLDLFSAVTSPLLYADLMGLMTYLTIVGGPGPWFELPSAEVAPAVKGHGELPPQRAVERQRSSWQERQSPSPVGGTNGRGEPGRVGAYLSGSR